MAQRHFDNHLGGFQVDQSLSFHRGGVVAHPTSRGHPPLAYLGIGVSTDAGLTMEVFPNCGVQLVATLYKVDERDLYKILRGVLLHEDRRRYTNQMRKREGNNLWFYALGADGRPVDGIAKWNSVIPFGADAAKQQAAQVLEDFENERDRLPVPIIAYKLGALNTLRTQGMQYSKATTSRDFVKGISGNTATQKKRQHLTAAIKCSLAGQLEGKRTYFFNKWKVPGYGSEEMWVAVYGSNADGTIIDGEEKWDGRFPWAAGVEHKPAERVRTHKGDMFYSYRRHKDGGDSEYHEDKDQDTASRRWGFPNSGTLSKALKGTASPYGFAYFRGTKELHEQHLLEAKPVHGV